MANTLLGMGAPPPPEEPKEEINIPSPPAFKAKAPKKRRGRPPKKASAPQKEEKRNGLLDAIPPVWAYKKGMKNEKGMILRTKAEIEQAVLDGWDDLPDFARKITK